MFVFVILHYLAEEMTSQCIESLEDTFDLAKIRIVVVDNGSGNGSGERLKEQFESEVCHIILSHENQGFARGNNNGYRYAKETWDPEFILVMNNDVIIRDREFLNKVSRIYDETGFFVCGPDILAVKTGQHQNPLNKPQLTEEQVNGLLADMDYRRTHNTKYYTDAIKSKLIIRTRLRRFKRRILHQKEPVIFVDERKENTPLHGACFIFSSKFIEKEQEAFDSRTFLYFEEEILFVKCIQKGYRVIYDPSIQIHHYEDVSTDASLGTKKSIKSMVEKRKFLDRHQYDSLQVLKKVLNGE